MNLWLTFITGLTSGGLSCLAVQGGLLTSIIANQKEDELQKDTATLKAISKKQKKAKYLQSLQHQNSLAQSFDQLDWLPVTLFLICKLISYTVLGFILGWVGSRFELSLSVRLIFQTIAALFMLGTAANLLQLHPIFRYLVFQPPKFLQRMVRNTSKSKALFIPALLGFMTIFIPCGITQAMEITAISLGNPLQGALIMFAFILGTSPIFAIVGIATAKLSETFQEKFMKVAAAALVIMGIVSLNGVLVVLNSPITIGSLTSPIIYFFSDERFSSVRYQPNYNNNGASQAAVAPVTNGIQQVAIEAKSNGYSPDTVQVKAGVPVQLTISTNGNYTCASSFILKAFGVNLQLGPTDTKTVAFTPTQPGDYPFTCSMGMYRGVLKVI